jgi:hypothetical protein
MRFDDDMRTAGFAVQSVGDHVVVARSTMPTDEREACLSDAPHCTHSRPPIVPERLAERWRDAGFESRAACLSWLRTAHAVVSYPAKVA